MGVKVTKRLTLNSIPLRFKKQFAMEIEEQMADEIQKTILSGKSPVDDKRFQKYSNSYSKTKGRKAPVDMLQEGTMLNSITVKLKGAKSAVIGFSDEKSEWHDKGLGSNPQRKLLPSRRGEKFSERIMKKIVRLLKKAVAEVLRGRRS